MSHVLHSLRIAIVIGVLVAVNISTADAQVTRATDLTYMVEDYPPANYLESGELKGASVELLKRIWGVMGVPEQPIQIVPWARGYRLVQEQKKIVLFSMSRTEARETLFKWVGPIFRARHVLVGLADNDITLTSLEDAKPFTIGTIKEDVGEIALFQSGFNRKKLESVSSLEQNIRKLLAGRIDFICQSEDSVRDFVKMNKYDPKQFKTFLVVNEMGNYYAFHKDTPEVLIQTFQKALESLEEERHEILVRYNMTP